MIIDCFPYLDEENMFKFRITELAPHVDYFVVVEMDTTHSGFPNQIKKPTLAGYEDKIIHYTVKCPYDPKPNTENFIIPTSWKKENYHRNASKDAIATVPGICNEDIVMICDCDEIPDMESILQLMEAKPKFIRNGLRLSLENYYYNLYTVTPKESVMPFVIAYGHLQEIPPQDYRVRFNRHLKVLNNRAGWHFSYFPKYKDQPIEKAVMQKLRTFAHTEILENQPLLNEYIIKQRIEMGLAAQSDDKEIEIRTELSDYLPKNYEMLL